MREPKLVNDGWHQCQNCGTIWNGRDLLDIEDYFQRVDAGEETPSGECPDPDCGALCHPHKPNAVKNRKAHGLGSGYCAERDNERAVPHGEFRMDSEATTCPTCEDALPS